MSSVRVSRNAAWVVPIVLGLAMIGGSAMAQTDNACGPGEAPDLVTSSIFGDGGLFGVNGHYWGTVDGIAGYSFGTDACNLGTCQANWIASTVQHPVIGQNLFRLKDGRFEHIGQSWLKHGFASENGPSCSEDCLVTDSQHLGVNCSDGYTAARNGMQSEMGPKSDVQAESGIFPWPPTDLDLTGDAIYKRLQVHVDDLDPQLNAGASYYVEAQYIARDDALGQNQHNNASWRAAQVEPRPGGGFSITLTGATQPETAAIFAWQITDPEVRITSLDRSGRYYIGARATDLGNGTWRYEYAVQNLNADGAGGFRVRVNGGASVSNIGFHDVDYHSGEPYDGTDWPGGFDTQAGEVKWEVASYDDDANFLRWGTLYNFRFDCNRPPELGTVDLAERYPDQSRHSTEMTLVQTWVPRACDDDGVCEPAEDCNNCPGDCSGMPISFCGDGICDPSGGEDCVSCGEDCNGLQSGTPSDRFCCGDGEGQNPVDCSDPRCRLSGFACSSPCCGDGICNFGEDRCSCGLDCGLAAPVELACGDGTDDDCDGTLDCADPDCCLDALCADGIDGDGDSVADCDCDDTNATVWDSPGEARDVTLAHDATSGETTLSWVEPIDLGGTSATYAVLRSASGSDFTAGAACLALGDPAATSATDSVAPPADAVFHYLVRAENACPGPLALGGLGIGSTGLAREGRSCP